MSVITIPKPLRNRLGEEASDALAEFVKEIDLDARKDALALAEERLERRLTEETGKLRLEIGKLGAVIKEEMGNLRAEIKEDMGSLKSEIKEDMGNLRAETIKWMFIFWVSQIGILSGIIFAILKLTIK